MRLVDKVVPDVLHIWKPVKLELYFYPSGTQKAKLSLWPVNVFAVPEDQYDEFGCFLLCGKSVFTHGIHPLLLGFVRFLA